jgi:hypothetical protein
VLLAVFIFAPATWSQEALVVLSGGMIDSTGALMTKAARTVEGRLCFGNGVPCLSSSHVVLFSDPGTNTLFNGIETARRPHGIHSSNGLNAISIVRNGECRIEATGRGLPVALHKL